MIGKECWVLSPFDSLLRGGTSEDADVEVWLRSWVKCRVVEEDGTRLRVARSDLGEECEPVWIESRDNISFAWTVDEIVERFWVRVSSPKIAAAVLTCPNANALSIAAIAVKAEVESLASMKIRAKSRSKR